MPDPKPPAQRSTLPSIEQEELRGISRTVAEIEWLLLILVLLYRVFGGPTAFVEPALSMAMFFYAAFVMSFRYTNFYRRETRWKIAVETLAMILFLTWALWFTGGLRSPLLNAYLLAVITAALTLGKTLTLAHVGLIALCYVFLDWQLGTHEMLRAALHRRLPRADRPGRAGRLHHDDVLGRHPLRAEPRQAAVGDRRADRPVQHARLRRRSPTACSRRRSATSGPRAS